MLQMMRQRRLASLVLVALGLAMTLAIACGGDDDDDGGETPDATSTRAATSAASTPSDGGETPEATTGGTPAAVPPGGDTTILIGDGGALGQILTTADGLTLYTFMNDTAGSGTSACEGACPNAWPPLIVEGEPSAPAGATGELGTVNPFKPLRACAAAWKCRWSTRGSGSPLSR